MRFRLLAAVAACAIASSGFVLTATSAFGAKKLDACKVLTSADIATAFGTGPLDPGSPATSFDPKASTCEWSQPPGESESEDPPDILTARVELTPLKGRTNFEVTGEGITKLTKQELKSIGADSGYISIPSPGSGEINMKKGGSRVRIWAGYTGLVPVPTVDKTGFLTLAKKVAKQV